jgi:hypothetical protein
MSLIEEARTVRQRIVARLRELEPLVQEYEELTLVAAELGIDQAEISQAPRQSAPRAGKRQRGRAGAGRRRSTGASRSSGPTGLELSDRVLDAVKANPGQTVAEYARALDLAPTSIYRPVRELTTSGAIVKRARQLFPG